MASFDCSRRRDAAARKKILNFAESCVVGAYTLADNQLTDIALFPFLWQNTAPAPMPGTQGGQAVAFRISGDKAFFFGCGFHGAQDTLCDDTGRHYFRDCHIEGSIDYVFGNARSLYKDCELHSTAERFGSVAAHGRRDPCERTGFAFVNCRVTGTGRLYVGRAMGQYSRIVYAYTYFDSVIAPGGWDDWDHASNKSMYVSCIAFRSRSNCCRSRQHKRSFTSTNRLINLSMAGRMQDGVLRDVQELGPRRRRHPRRAVGAGARLLRCPPLPRQELRQRIPLAHA
jgi:hypothetical protein